MVKWKSVGDSHHLLESNEAYLLSKCLVLKCVSKNAGSHHYRAGSGVRARAARDNILANDYQI